MSDSVAISELEGVALANLIARRGRLEELRAAVRNAWRVDPPLTPLRAEGDGASFIWAGPECWLVEAPSAPAELVCSLRARTDGLAAVCDQSDGHLLLRVSGHFARDVLAKGIAVNLHPSVFKPGSTAMTLCGHIGCQIWQVDDTPTYDVAVPRSFAASFKRWLVDAIRPAPLLGAERVG